MTDDKTLAAARWITDACGNYPDAIKPVGAGFDFEARPTKIALEAFPSDEDTGGTLYEIVRTEISGDEEGWYYEAIFYNCPPVDGQSGSVVEGMYSRRVETKGEIEARFDGHLIFTDEADHARNAELGRVRHYRRTLDELTNEISYYLDQFISNIRMLGGAYPSAVLQDKMAQTMRAITSSAGAACTASGQTA